MALQLEHGRQNEASGQLLQQLQIAPEQRVSRAVSRHRQWISAAIVFAVALAIGAATIFVLRRERFEVETVTAVSPQLDAVPQSSSAAILQATGYVTARREATVSAQVTGTLSEVLIEEGEHVEAGQVLARLENEAQKAAVTQAKAQLKSARASLGQYDLQLAQARRDLERSEVLRTRQLISEQAFETTRAQVQTLQAQVESRREEVQLVLAAVRGSEVQLDYTTIRAPFSGVVVAKAAQAGEIVSPDSAGGGFTRTGVGTIVDMDSLEIEVDVNEAYINRVKPDQLAQAKLDAYPDWTIPAHVIAIVPTAVRSKATVKVRVGIELKDRRILPDMGVRVSFLTEASNTSASTGDYRPGDVLVPASAIVARRGSTVVFTVNGDRARAKAVSSGRRYGDLRLIEGISSGTTVVREPPANMSDGARIIVKAPLAMKTVTNR